MPGAECLGCPLATPTGSGGDLDTALPGEMESRESCSGPRDIFDFAVEVFPKATKVNSIIYTTFINIYIQSQT